MCRVLKIARAGYYAWLHEPESGRTIENKRLLQLIRSSYDASYGIYGYRRITLDLKELGESCGPNRVLKIMKNNGIAAVRGYKKHKRANSNMRCDSLKSLMIINKLSKFL